MDKCKCSVEGCVKIPKNRSDGSCFPYCWEHRETTQQNLAAPEKEERGETITKLALLKISAITLQASVNSQPMGAKPLTPADALELVVTGLHRLQEAMK